MSDTRSTALDFACTPEELRFLQLYRAVDDAGERPIARLLTASERGLLPPTGEPKTPAEIDRLLDSLPEVEL